MIPEIILYLLAAFSSMVIVFLLAFRKWDGQLRWLLIIQNLCILLVMITGVLKNINLISSYIVSYMIVIPFFLIQAWLAFYLWIVIKRGHSEILPLQYSLFKGLPTGFALYEMIFDINGKPVDYKFISVNPAFELLTGLRSVDILGKNVSKILPGNEKIWYETYGKVVLTGVPAFFRSYSKELKRYYEVTAFKPDKMQFITIFTDVTHEYMGSTSPLFGGILESPTSD